LAVMLIIVALTSSTMASTKKKGNGSSHSHGGHGRNESHVHKKPVNPIQASGPHKFTVLTVADGDTANVRNKSNGQTVRVRFLCIDAPEKSQAPWGERSLNKLKELLPINSEVTLISDKKDIYNRTLSQIVTSSGVNINKKMVELGMAVYYSSQRDCKDFASIETTAKKNKVGIWSDKTFEMPMDYRKRMGIGKRGEQAREEAARHPKSSTRRSHL